MNRFPNLSIRRRDLLLSAAGSLPLLAARRASAAVSRYLVYWGIYTAGGARYGTGESKGIYFSHVDTATGNLTPPELAAESVNPSFLAIHRAVPCSMP